MRRVRFDRVAVSVHAGGSRAGQTSEHTLPGATRLHQAVAYNDRQKFQRNEAGLGRASLIEGASCREMTRLLEEQGGEIRGGE